MPTACPTHEELIESVREFVEQEILPAVEGRLAFNTRVAINVLGIVQREIALGEAADEAERAGLVELLGRAGSREELNRALCEHLRAGEQDIPAPALRKHLSKTTMAKLAIDNPKYASYRRAQETGQDSLLD